MERIKHIYTNNKAIILSTAMLVLCAQAVNALIRLTDNESVDLTFTANGALKILCMLFGIACGYVLISRINVKLSPAFALFCVVGMSVSNYYCCTGRFAYDTLVMSCLSVVAVYFLAVYYLSRCRESVLHMIFYILINLQFCYVTIGNINAFFGYGLQVLLFLRFNQTIKNKYVRIANIVYSFNSICWIITLFISNIYDYFTFEFTEGHKMAVVQEVIKTMKPFGRTEKVNGIIDYPYFELTKICGLYGYVFAAVIVLFLLTFALCILLRAYRSGEGVQPAIMTLAAVTVTQLVISVPSNFGILFDEIDACLPVISDGASGYLITGILLGTLFKEAGGNEKTHMKSREMLKV